MKNTKNTSSPQPREKTQPEEFDLVILGGGTGSTIAAWTFAGEGKRVAVVDRKYIGGSCPNIACLPSKNIIHSAKVVDYFRRSKEFGIAHDLKTYSSLATRWATKDCRVRAGTHFEISAGEPKCPAQFSNERQKRQRPDSG